MSEIMEGEWNGQNVLSILNGNAIAGDSRVNENLFNYVARKFNELDRLRAEVEGLRSLITECTDNGELDSRLFESYIGHVTGKARPAPVVPEARAWNQAGGRDHWLETKGWNTCREEMLSAAKEPQC
jgi:hypothetical protein